MDWESFWPFLAALRSIFLERQFGNPLLRAGLGPRKALDARIAAQNSQYYFKELQTKFLNAEIR